MKKSQYRYQSKNFNFPKNVYIGCIKAEIPGGEKRLVYLSRVFENLDVLKRYVLFVINDFAKTVDDITLSYDGYFIRANFGRLFPLTPSHWKNPNKLNENLYQKFRNDINILKYWGITEVLITPDGEIDGVEFYSLCSSLFKGASNQDIDLLIKNSNQTVDIRAKNASLYELKKPVKINWLSVKMSDTIQLEKFVN